jgi:hypothetical protein
VDVRWMKGGCKVDVRWINVGVKRKSSKTYMGINAILITNRHI